MADIRMRSGQNQQSTPTVSIQVDLIKEYRSIPVKKNNEL